MGKSISKPSPYLATHWIVRRSSRSGSKRGFRCAALGGQSGPFASWGCGLGDSSLAEPAARRSAFVDKWGGSRLRRCADQAVLALSLRQRARRAQEISRIARGFFRLRPRCGRPSVRKSHIARFLAEALPAITSVAGKPRSPRAAGIVLLALSFSSPSRIETPTGSGSPVETGDKWGWVGDLLGINPRISLE